MPKCKYCPEQVEWPKNYVKGSRPLVPGTDRIHVCEPEKPANFESELRPLERELREQERTASANIRTDGYPPDVNIPPRDSITFESADETLKHDFSFRSTEITIGRTRKVSENTLAGLPKFESIEFSVYQKFQVDYTTDVPRLIKETWAQMALQIEREIDAEGERLNP